MSFEAGRFNPIQTPHPAEHSSEGGLLVPNFERLPNFHGDKGSAEDSGHVEWAANIKDAVERAQTSGKPVIMVFEEPNCGWCQQYEKELAKPEVASLNNDAIFVRANPSLDPDARALANSLNVTSYPTTSILDITGTHVSERSRTIGYMSSTDLVRQFEQKGTMMA